MSTRLQNGPRGALVYPVAGHRGLYRIRLEKYPEYSEPSSGWFGGRVLWNYDQLDEDDALDIAEQWVRHGKLPPGIT